jgi:hypothetical protein
VPYPPVVVEIAPPQSPPELRRTLLDACSRAVRESTCVEPSAAGPETPVAVAVVSWFGKAKVRVEVALRREQQWIVREIQFSERDPAPERWRAAGLVIGTLASVVSRGGELPAGKRSTAPRESESPASEPSANADLGVGTESAKRAAPPDVWLELVAKVGPGLDPGPLRLGPELGVRVGLADLPLYASASVSYAEGLERSNDVRASWFEGFAGLGAQRSLGGAFVGLVHLEALAQRFAVSVSTQGSEAPAGGDRFLGGVRIGASLGWWVSEPLGFVVGVHGKWITGATDVRVRGERVAVAPVLSYSAGAGFLYGFR